MKTLFLLCLSLLLTSIPINAQDYFNYYSVYFVDEANGWIAGGRGLPTPRGIVIKTTDGGESWNSHYYTDEILFSIYFTDQYNGCAVGNNGTIIRSTDGGQNWTEFPKLTDADLKSVSFINQNIGWTAGNNQDSIYLLKTTDRGENWILQQVPQFYFNVNELQFVNEDIGFIVGNQSLFVGMTIKTTDGGMHWTKLVDSGWVYGPYDLHFLDENVGWVVGYRISKTTDGGLNWVEQYLNSYVELRSVHFVNSNLGWAAGQGFLSYESLPFAYVLKTTDGGTNWGAQYPPRLAESYSIYFISETTGWSVGWWQNIVKTTDGGNNWVHLIAGIDYDISSELPKNFLLSQNYPNPFNPITTIKYQIPKLSFITIKIYDVLGNEIATLVNEEKPAGSYEVEFIGKGLSSGVYFYKLRAGNYVETRKMVLLK